MRAYCGVMYYVRWQERVAHAGAEGPYLQGLLQCGMALGGPRGLYILISPPGPVAFSPYT